jgi:glycosyltransferase involved in cell wall biosynthesis
MATLTVVMPNYNHGRVLGRAVSAFLAQTVAVDVVIVDDASTDDSVEVIRTLAASNRSVRYLRRETNGGPSAAINDGLATVTSEYVTLAAADDIVSPLFVERSIESLARHPDAAFSFLDPSVFDERTGTTSSVPLALSEQPQFFAPDVLESLFRRNTFTISSNTVVYRREAIAAIGGFRVDLQRHCDWMANLVLAFRHGACYRPETLAHFRVDPAGYGSTSVRSADDRRALLFRCLEAIQTDYVDVADHFRRAALVPDPGLETLRWMTQDPRGRAFLTPALTTRLLQREAWSWMRPIVPKSARRWMRRLAAASTRQDIGPA